MFKDCKAKTAENRHSSQDGRENCAQSRQWDSEQAENTAARVQHHADAILRASGSALRHYTMDGTRRAILSAVMDCYEEAYLSAVMDCYEEAYRAGANRAMALRAGEVG